MSKGYHHLTYEDRCQIFTLLKQGSNQSNIAKFLGVSRSTIFREINRNSGQRGYRFKQAQRFSAMRRHQASCSPKKMKDCIISVIKKKLGEQWSPSQISGWMKETGQRVVVSYETIYQYVWKDKRSGGYLYKELRHNGKKYNRRSKGKAGRGCIPGRVGIEERPVIVDQKVRIGDWEIDTIIGKNHRGAIVSVVDRHSKFTLLRLVSGKTSEEVTAALLDCLIPLKDITHTLTADNGKEFSGHREVSSCLDAAVYFARPYHSWERGLNEHTNGLVRQYFPKGESFENLSSKDVAKVEDLLNNRPRKSLGFQTPRKVFLSQL